MLPVSEEEQIAKRLFGFYRERKQPYPDRKWLRRRKRSSMKIMNGVGIV